MRFASIELQIAMNQMKRPESGKSYMSASTNGTTLVYPNRAKAEEPTTTKEPITKPPAKGKKSLVRWLALSVVILGVIAGVWYCLYSSQFEETDDDYLTGHDHPVTVRDAETIYGGQVND